MSFEYEGSLQRLALSSTLWLVPLMPLIGALALATAGRRAELRARGADELFRARRRMTAWAIAASALALVATSGHAALLARLPASDRFLLEHVLRLVRAGQLDANLDLAFDPVTATLALVAVGIATAALAVARVTAEPPGWRALAWGQLLVGAGLVALLADNAALMLAAWEAMGLAAWGLLGRAPSVRALVTGGVGSVALALGFATLFWALGGSWGIDGYTTDLSPRFVAVQLPRAGAADEDDERAPAPSRASERDEDEDEARAPLAGEGYLTLASHPGAIV